VARKALAASLFITATVIDPRCLKLYRPRPQGKLAPLGLTVAHHQRASVLVALATMALDVIVGLRLKRFDQHPPGALARDLIQRQKLLTGFPRSLLLDYRQHRWRPPSTRLPPGFAWLTQKDTPPFSCRLDPQLLVIARADDGVGHVIGSPWLPDGLGRDSLIPSQRIFPATF